MFIQLKNNVHIEGVINFLKYSGRFHLKNAVIERILGIPEDIKDCNTLEITLVCNIVTEASVNYDEYKTVHLEYLFNIKKNRIVCNSETGTSVIKEIVGLVFG
jgi:hypothetical protein